MKKYLLSENKCFSCEHKFFQRHLKKKFMSRHVIFILFILERTNSTHTQRTAASSRKQASKKKKKSRKNQCKNLKIYVEETMSIM